MSFYQQFRSVDLGSISDAAGIDDRIVNGTSLSQNSKVQILVINKKEDRERLEFQTDQLDRLGLTFFHLDAYTDQTIPKSISRGYWRRWRHPLPPKVRAKFLSHAVAWDWVSKNGPALILEDDALLVRSMPEILKNLESMTGIDHLNLEARGRQKLLGKSHIPIGHGISGHKLYLDKFGAAAYVLWPSGAEKLMKRTRRGAAPPEGMAQWASKLVSYQADPACAVQLDMAETYGLPHGTDASPIEKAAKQPAPVTPGQQIRTSFSRLHKVWRAVRYSMSTTRRRVNVRPEFFD